MRDIYIALENVNLDWKEKELKRFEALWKDEIAFVEICKELKRTQLEVAAIIMDRAEKGFIKKRKHGLDGFELIKEEAV